MTTITNSGSQGCTEPAGPQKRPESPPAAPPPSRPLGSSAAPVRPARPAFLGRGWPGAAPESRSEQEEELLPPVTGTGCRAGPPSCCCCSCGLLRVSRAGRAAGSQSSEGIARGGSRRPRATDARPPSLGAGKSCGREGNSVVCGGGGDNRGAGWPGRGGGSGAPDRRLLPAQPTPPTLFPKLTPRGMTQPICTWAAPPTAPGCSKPVGSRAGLRQWNNIEVRQRL